jgi:hypothetical protein
MSRPHKFWYVVLTSLAVLPIFVGFFLPPGNGYLVLQAALFLPLLLAISKLYRWNVLATGKRKTIYTSKVGDKLALLIMFPLLALLVWFLYVVSTQ